MTPTRKVTTQISALGQEMVEVWAYVAGISPEGAIGFAATRFAEKMVAENAEVRAAWEKRLLAMAEEAAQAKEPRAAPVCSRCGGSV